MGLFVGLALSLNSGGMQGFALAVTCLLGMRITVPRSITLKPSTTPGQLPEGITTANEK